MKGLLVLIATLFVANAFTISEIHEQKWKSFKAEHGKEYMNHEHEMYRKEIFLDNLRKFEKHNEKYEMGLVTYTLGINKFSDMTHEEFLATLTLMSPPNYSNPIIFVPPADFVSEDSLDWRQKGAVTGVKDQRQCGSCWAFSTTGSLEGTLFIKSGSLPVVSEQNLVDCASGNCNGCKGGWLTDAFQYVIDNGGIDSESSYPYEAHQGKCRYNPQNSVGTISKVGQVESGNEQALKDAVASVGPISVALNADTLMSYHGGILNDPDCDGPVNHGMLVVGYGTEKGQDYYIVKNSWGKGWGEQGYARMARNQNNQCSIASYGTYGIV